MAAEAAQRVSARPRVVIGVIGDDIHIVGNRIMQLALEESGCRVFNLRTRNRPEHFVQAALEVNAHAVFVSSLNGEGEHWCADFRRRFSDVGLDGTLLYVGGNVVVGSRPEPEVVALFKSYGFDRVYHQRPDIGAAIVDLFEDLKRHGPAPS
jgi:methylaspartate mutase sigma subunit